MQMGHDYPKLVARIHQAATSSACWPELLQGITQATGAAIGGLILQGDGKAAEIVATTGADPAALQSYSQHYRALDPVIPLILTQPIGSVLTQEMVIGRSKMVRTEFYNDWLRPQGVEDCLAATVSNGETPGVLAFAVPANEHTFQRRAIELVRLLVPHLSIALWTHRHIGQLISERDAALAALEQTGRAVFFVDVQARVLSATRAAAELVQRADGLACNRTTGLYAATPDDTTALRKMIAHAAGRAGKPAHGGSLSLPRPSGAKRLLVTIVPIFQPDNSQSPVSAAMALVLVAPTGVSIRTLQELYGLTAAEARVAQLIALGRGVGATSESLQLARSTVRTHLLRVFAKTTTTRQAELAQLLAGLQK